MPIEKNAQIFVNRLIVTAWTVDFVHTQSKLNTIKLVAVNAISIFFSPVVFFLFRV